MNGRQDRDQRHPCLLSGDPDETPVEYLRDAQESCEKTGADTSVLEKLGTHIEYAAAVYRASFSANGYKSTIGIRLHLMIQGTGRQGCGHAIKHM